MNPTAPRSDVRSLLIAASPAEVYAAIRDPGRIARWWGPDGFTNTVHVFEFVAGGLWTLTMHGPDGQDYPNESRILLVEPDRVFAIEHFSGHHFILTLDLEEQPDGTLVNWQQTFDTVEHYQSLAAFIATANQQNLERLAAEVRRGLAAA